MVAVNVYCEREDMYDYGLTRGVIANQARLVDSALASTDVFVLDGHGFGDSDRRTVVVFRAEAGGILCGGVTSGATYYAQRVNDSSFQIYADSTTPTPVDLTTDGVSVVVSAQIDDEKIRELYSRWVDDFMPAHLVPFTDPVPVRAKAIVAELSAKKLLSMGGQSSDIVTATELAAKAVLERWAKGIPLRDSQATAPSNLAVTASASRGDPRGWVRPGWERYLP